MSACLKQFRKHFESTATPLTWNSLPPAVFNCDSLYFRIIIIIVIYNLDAMTIECLDSNSDLCNNTLWLCT